MARNGAHVARWLSQGLEDLLCKLGPRDHLPPEIRFRRRHRRQRLRWSHGCRTTLRACRSRDRQDVRLCVLERGREYLSGMFPVSEAELPGHVRISTASRAQNPREGGWSLGSADGPRRLRAGGQWPWRRIAHQRRRHGEADRDRAALRRVAAETQGSKCAFGVLRQKRKALLAPGTQRKFSQFGDSPDDPVPLKFRALEAISSRQDFSPAPLSIAIDGGTNSAGISLAKCISCGDCATGCNHQAKNSLDQNCLVIARRRGAEIYCGATVLRLERMPDSSAPGWKLHVVHTDPDLRRRGGTLELRRAPRHSRGWNIRFHRDTAEVTVRRRSTSRLASGNGSRRTVICSPLPTIRRKKSTQSLRKPMPSATTGASDRRSLA